jgi:hypothetical protein
VISEVKASIRGGQVQIEARITDETGVLSATCHHRSKGGKWEDSPMTKDEFEDVFRASFAGGGDIEYWIDSSDLLGNGPATHGSASRPIALAGTPTQEVATREPKEHKKVAKHAKVAKGPPVIQHQKPAGPLPDGQEVVLRARVKGASPISSTGVFLRKQGQSSYEQLPLKRTDGDNYEARIPADKAHGTLEYLLAAKDDNRQQSFGGDGNSTTPFVITFKQAGPVEQPFAFAINPPQRAAPGAPVTVRAQITVPYGGEEIAVPARAQVLWRGNDGKDQATAMQADPSGGVGGFTAQLPAQNGGALYYQVVACDASGNKCAISTGSKRRWHAVAISAAAGARPPPLDAASSNAPRSLPE